MTEYRPGGFQLIPPVIKNLIIINVIIYLAQYTLGEVFNTKLIDLFALHDVRSPLFRPHQLITYLFLHGSWQHVLYNMLALWVFGSMLENYWGAKRFLMFYMICGIGAAVAHLAALYPEMTPAFNEFHEYPIIDQQQYGDNPNLPMNAATLGASGAVFGCLAAAAWLFPNTYLYIYFLFPVKIKWVVIFYAAGELVSGVNPTAGDNVAHWAHLGGGLVGLLLVMYWNRTNRRNFY
jgi:membrane associated rhomboid family serine protease